MSSHVRVTHGMSVGCVCLIAVMLGVAAPAVAQQEQGTRAESFEMGEIQDQMELDVTPVPTGMGAIFVPSLTDPNLEPKVLVFSGTDRVASGRVAKRIVLPPGTYRVVVGEGPVETRASREVEVVEGVTSPVEPFFGAVRVTAVDTAGNPISVNYIIGQVGKDATWGPGETAEASGYMETQTWILPDGRFSLALGRDAKADRDSFVFPLAQGQVLRYRLVVEDDALKRVEFAEREIAAEPSIWRLQWVLGGDLGLDRTQRQLASFNGSALRLGAYTNATVGLDTANHLALTTVRLDESWIALESEFGRGLPLQKLTDELNVQLLYNYRLGGIIGPYVRATGRTSFFDTLYFPDEDVTLETTDINGESAVRTASRGDEVELFDGLFPLIFQEGVGAGLTFVDNDTVTFIVRAGGAARQSYYDGGRFITGEDNGRINLLRLEDKQDFGGEATAVFGLRLGGIFSIESTFESFLPREQIFGDSDFQPVYRFDNYFTLSVGSFAAIVYEVTLRRDDIQIDDMQVRQNLSLRLQSTLF